MSFSDAIEATRQALEESELPTIGPSDLSGLMAAARAEGIALSFPRHDAIHDGAKCWRRTTILDFLAGNGSDACGVTYR